MLLIFAFIAGIITSLSPCILPVLPLLLAAGVGQGKYRPYAIIVGLIASFTFFTLGLTALVHATHISASALRLSAIGLIIFFGLTMIFPQLERLLAKLTAPITHLGATLEQTSIAQSGVASGLILGAALGLIWAPCAGPILATVTTLAATGTVTLQAVIITLAYSVGTALPMFFILYGGAQATRSISFIAPYTEIIRKFFGVLMIIGALAIAFHADTLVQQTVIGYFPFVTEDNPLIQKELEKLKIGAGLNNNKVPMEESIAPEFAGIKAWINSEMLTMSQLKGKVVLVDFWTYSCINCVRTLPSLKKWYQKYKDKGFVIIGVHTPEFAFEHDIKNVKNAIKRFDIAYPVALDNDYMTWKNYHNNYWPAHYLIDQHGIIKYIHFGEGAYDKTENVIRSLLGLEPLAQEQEKNRFVNQTREIYLGYARAAAYAPSVAIKNNIETRYTFEGAPLLGDVGLNGSWLVSSEFITSKDDPAQLSLKFQAQQVYLVISAEKPAVVKVFLDGQPHGQVTVTEARMYQLLDLNQAGKHTLTLQVPGNVSLYAFTFGTD